MSRLATLIGRNTFVILRTGCSLPVALHRTLGAAVTFRFRPENVGLEQTSTALTSDTCDRTHSREGGNLGRKPDVKNQVKDHRCPVKHRQ